MLSHKGLSDLIDLIDEMFKKNQQLEEVFETSISIFEVQAEKLQHWILTELCVPEDNTVEMVELYGTPEGFLHDDTFCRDVYTNWFFEYREKEINKEKLIFNLLNWKTDAVYN